MLEVNTGVLSEALNSFLNIFEAGVGRLTPGAMSIFGVLTALELTLASLWWAYSGNEALGKFIKKGLLIFFLLWVMQKYQEILGWVVEGFKYAGNTAAGGVAPLNVMEDPSKILDTGLILIDPMFNLAIRLGGDWNFFDALVTLICSLIVFFAYVILALQVFLTRLEFALVTTLGLILIPFGVFKHTSFIADKVFGAILSFGVKLMVLTLIIQISFPLLSSYQLPIDPEWKPMLTLSAISIAFAILAIHAPGVASGLLSGTPNLASTAINTGAAIATNTYGGLNTSSRLAGAGVMAAGGMALSKVSAASRVQSFGEVSENKVSNGSFGIGNRHSEFNGSNSVRNSFGARRDGGVPSYRTGEMNEKVLKSISSRQQNQEVFDKYSEGSNGVIKSKGGEKRVTNQVNKENEEAEKVNLIPGKDISLNGINKKEREEGSQEGRKLNG